MWKLYLPALIFIVSITNAIAPIVPPRVDPSSQAENLPVEGPEALSPLVTLRAASGKTILFKTGNGVPREGRPSQEREIPHLVLKRNGVLTSPEERSLLVTVAGFQAPPPGITVTLSIETQHGDPDAGGSEANRITVWWQSMWVENSIPAEVDAPAVIPVVFEAQVLDGGRPVPTPSDYFRLAVTAGSGEQPASRFEQDFAFLMENQWTATLPPLLEETDGAAPDELVVYYSDMFPFERDANDPATRLPREQLDDYMQDELVPGMVEAIRLQTDEWAFPWYATWRSYRPEDGNRLSVALTQNATWYHGAAPLRGDASMALRVDGGMAEYESLTHGLMATFHHELFHNLQRNIALHETGRGSLKGAAGAWELFVEGTAVMASSVAQPDIQFDQSWGRRSYLFRARKFVGQAGFTGNQMNESYFEIDPYSTALYWRFLYESCGGMSRGREDPAAGMRVIRRTLEVLYSGEVVDVSASTDVVGNLARILDAVFTEIPGCPFGSYSESMTHFADSLYRLKLTGGRCQAPGYPAGCGLFDPNGLYPEPPVESIPAGGPAEPGGLPWRALTGNIPNSYGMDFVEIPVDPELRGSSLTVDFSSLEELPANFEIRLWKLAALEPAIPGGPPLAASGEPEALGKPDPSGRLRYTLAPEETSRIDRLGLVITRVDDREAENPDGSYRIEVNAQ